MTTIGALVGLVMSLEVIALLNAARSTVLTLLIMLYFIVIDGRAMTASDQGALITSGVVQQRFALCGRKIGSAGTGVARGEYQ